MDQKQIYKKIEEFFFDFTRSREEYEKFYKKNNPEEKHVRFSPLYLICRDIQYCFGKNPEIGEPINTGSKFGPAKLAGVVLISSAVHMLASFLVVKENKLNFFVKNYMGLSTKDGERIELLRNAIVHINYSLLYKDQKKKQEYHFELNEKLEALIIEKDLNHYSVNPVIFKKNFFNLLSSFRNDLKENIAFKNKFDQVIKKEEWIIILS